VSASINIGLRASTVTTSSSGLTSLTSNTGISLDATTTLTIDTGTEMLVTAVGGTRFIHQVRHAFTKVMLSSSAASPTQPMQFDFAHPTNANGGLSNVHYFELTSDLNLNAAPTGAQEGSIHTFVFVNNGAHGLRFGNNFWKLADPIVLQNMVQNQAYVFTFLCYDGTNQRFVEVSRAEHRSVHDYMGPTGTPLATNSNYGTAVTQGGVAWPPGA
jgi:hypothetical protein